MILKLLIKLRIVRIKREFKVTYDEDRRRYYVIYEGYPYNLNENERVFDENMTLEEASKYAHELNTEIGLTLYTKEDKKAICPVCNYTLTRDGCGDYDVYCCPVCVEYIPSSFCD